METTKARIDFARRCETIATMYPERETWEVEGMAWLAYALEAAALGEKDLQVYCEHRAADKIRAKK